MADIETLYETCEFLEKDLREMNDKIRANNGKLTNDSLAYIDKLTHAIKSIKSTIVMEESSYSERGYSRDGMSYARGDDYSRDHGDMSYNHGTSYARGRGSNAKRDGMGRYSRDSYDGYSRDDARKDMVMQLRDLMQDAEPNMRGEFQTFITKLERM